jgi:histidinol-phosphate aminotransferase
MTQTASGALPYIADIEPYNAGKPLEALAKELGMPADKIILLNANENPIGFPESAAKAVEKMMSRGHCYPDGGAFDLKGAVAKRYGVGEDCIIQGNGSDELIGLIAQVYLEGGRRCVVPEHSFSVYSLAAHINGADITEVPPKADFSVDFDGIAAAVDDRTALIFITNPDNPTGLYASPETVETFLAKVPQRVTVVLDEAYVDFVPKAERSVDREVLARHPNVIILHTFSKAYGLAGLRIGFALAGAGTIEVLNRIRPPYNANRLAQAAAVAALGDDAFVEKTVKTVTEGVERSEKAFGKLGLRFVHTRTNFMMVEVPNADDVQAALLKAGIIVRGLRSYGLPGWLRISVGSPENMKRFFDVFEKALAKNQH